MRVHIPGKPIPYPRSGGSGSRRYTPGPFRDWLELAAKAIAETDGIELGIAVPVAVSIAVTPHDYQVELLALLDVDAAAKSLRIDFHEQPLALDRPKGLRGDLDNYVKAVLDAMQHRDQNPLAPPGWILNDRQVVAVAAWFSP